MPAIVCNARFSTTCPKRPNSIQNASVFLSGVLNVMRGSTIVKMFSLC
ncbi:unnamed protein product [Tenebrio molitor]|nr:unnamed protein product [Tenebrio molitor]